MIEKITLDMLNNFHVSVKTDKYFDVNGELIYVETHRKTYENSNQGRLLLQSEVSEPYKSVVLMIWGDSPLLSDESFIN